MSETVKQHYITIQEFMVKDLELKGNELIAYALIYGFSQDEESYFKGSLSYVANWLNCSKTTAHSILNKLADDGFLEKKEKNINGVKLCDYAAVVPNKTELKEAKERKENRKEKEKSERRSKNLNTHSKNDNGRSKNCNGYSKNLNRGVQKTLTHNTTDILDDIKNENIDDNLVNSFSNEKDNSKPNGLELHNSQVVELGTPAPEPQEDISPKTKSNITRTFGVIKHESKQHELKDMPTRAKEIAYELSEDEMLSDKAYGFMECFLEYYKAYRHKEHPNLTNPVLKRAVNDMLSGMTQHIEPKDGEAFDNDYYPLICHEVDRKDFEEVINQYFQTKFTQKTDYGICHFLDENVLPKIMNKCMLHGGNWYESHEPY